MTDTPTPSGPGSSPGTDDEVTVSRPGSSADAPVMDGAQELRDDAAQARAQDVESRAEHTEGPGPSAQQATQTARLEQGTEGAGRSDGA